MPKELLPAKVILPNVLASSESMLTQVTTALGLPRDVLPSDEQIAHAWENLPRLIAKVPMEMRDERLVRMCVAVSSGLFDAAINYIWNSAIIELREKVRRFGIAVIPQVLDRKDFDESSLLELRDAELLDLCLKLNLIGDDDFFFLDQCRETRNNFSAAHPADGAIDEYEFIGFLSRCQKHALVSQNNPKGVDVKNLLNKLRGGRFKPAQREVWIERIGGTFDAQRELIFTMLHGVYCDPSQGEETRSNALGLCEKFSDSMTPRARSALVDQHQEYRAKGDEKREAASRQFFERLGQLSILGEAEVHSIITGASRRLLEVHNAFDNFYNEPPFAERLYGLTEKNAVPNTAKAVFVEAVITCGMGNPYGVSNSAMPYYRKMVRSFSPAEIEIMLRLSREDTIPARRLKQYSQCAKRFISLVEELEPSSVPTSVRNIYKSWLKKS